MKRMGETSELVFITLSKFASSYSTVDISFCFGVTFLENWEERCFPLLEVLSGGLYYCCHSSYCPRLLLTSLTQAPVEWEHGDTKPNRYVLHPFFPVLPSKALLIPFTQEISCLVPTHQLSLAALNSPLSFSHPPRTWQP